MFRKEHTALLLNCPIFYKHIILLTGHMDGLFQEWCQRHWVCLAPLNALLSLSTGIRKKRLHCDSEISRNLLFFPGAPVGHNLQHHPKTPHLLPGNVAKAVSYRKRTNKCNAKIKALCLSNKSCQSNVRNFMCTLLYVCAHAGKHAHPCNVLLYRSFR